MKHILLILVIALLALSCTKEYDNPEILYTDVGMEFDRWVKSNSPNTFTAATEYTNNHILSNSTVAELTVTPTNGRSETIRVRKKMNDIVYSTVSLRVGLDYVFEIKYDSLFADGTTKIHDNGLAFNAISDTITVQPTMATITMYTSTWQSLILIDKEGIDSTFVPRFSKGDIDTTDNSIIAWQLFDSPYFWYVYITPLPETNGKYYFQYQPLDTSYPVTVYFADGFLPETPYMISEVEPGNTNLSFDYDNLFGNVIIVNL